MALAGRGAIIGERPVVVLRHALAQQIQIAQIKLGIRVAKLCRLLVELRSPRQILLNPTTLLVAGREFGEGNGILTARQRGLVDHRPRRRGGHRSADARTHI